MSIYKTTLTGAAGEHYIIFRLLSLGYIAGLAPQGAPNSDLIVTDIKGKKAVAIQVKTRMNKGTDNGWHMKEKHEKLVEKNLFYCFIDLPDKMENAPIVYIIPSQIIAKVIGDAHKIWLSTPGKNGIKHNETDMRRLLPDYSKTLKSDHVFIKEHSLGWLDKYKENWSILGL